MNFRVDVIKPGKTLEIPITFYPRETISYRELIPFEINGLSQQVIEIKGKGTEMKVSDSWEDHRAWHQHPLALLSHLAHQSPHSSDSISPAPWLLCQRSASPIKADQTPENHIDLASTKHYCIKRYK